MPLWLGLIIRPHVRLARPRFGTVSRPPSLLVFGGVFLFVLYVLGGNVFTLIRSPPPIAGGSSGQPILILPTAEAQLGLEGVVVSFVIAMGTLGLGSLYYGSKFVFQPGRAMRIMIAGFVMVGLAYLLMFYMYGLKTS
ncbi:MAG: hypothetical protein HXY34_08330 [Candidatus Thorarchaeota archaeon]|nr:hypothetical protein [Candidatus Thorarchaeota archaeon]